MPRKYTTILFALAAVLATADAGADVVISQVYGGGGNTGTTYKNDFVELFNDGSTAVSLNGYAVQYFAASSGNSGGTTPLTNVTLQPGEYYLVQEAAGTGGTTDLPTPDATGSLNFSGTSGIVALLNTTTAVSNGCPIGKSGVVDVVGYGTGTAQCANPAAVLTNTTAAIRKGGGCTQTNNNANDFDSSGAPNPRNSATTFNVCSGGSTGAPTGTGTANPNSVPNDGTTTTTLSVDATPGTGASSITSVTVDLTSIGGANPLSLTDSGDHEHFSLGGVTVSASTSAGAKSLPATITDDQNHTGTANIALTVTQVPVTIMQVNGHGTFSPMYKQIVTITGGVVTALEAKGFFMQDPVGDGDITTSDGIFVYVNKTPTVAVGDSVTVTGTVDEYDSYEIEIDGTVTVTDNGPGTMPTPYDLNANPPTDDPTTGICANPALDPLTDHAAITDGFAATNFACLNDMLVSFSNATVVGAVGGSSPNTPSGADGGGGNTPDNPQYFYATLAPTREFREPGITYGDPALTNINFPTYKNPYNGPVFSGHPNIFQVYYQSLAGFSTTDLPDVGFGHGVYNVGQTVSVTTGVLQQFAFTAKIGSTYYPDSSVGYEIYPLTGGAVSVSGAGLSLPQPVADSAPGTLTIGSQNALHFFNAKNDGQDSSAYFDACLATSQQVSGNLSGLNIPLNKGDNDTCPTDAQYATRLSKMSLQIRDVLKAPSVQVLQETESLSVLGDIVGKIYTDSVDNQDNPVLAYKPFLFKGNDPQGINIGILVKDNGDIAVNSVSQLALNATTSACSSGSSCLLNDRPPVLLEATFKGAPFRVLAIYDRSLSNLSSSTYVGQKRRAQAEQVARIVQTLQTDGATLPSGSTGDSCSARVDGTGAAASCVDIAGSSTTPLVVVGDFNANEFSDGYVDVTGTITGTVDTDPTHSVFPPTANYTAPNPTLVDPAEATLDPATNPLTWNPNYSYSFDGLSEEIDHILLTRAGYADFVRISHSHGNSDVSSASSDVSDPTTPRRLSDHDGQVITLTLDRIFADGFEAQP